MRNDRRVVILAVCILAVAVGSPLASGVTVQRYFTPSEDAWDNDDNWDPWGIPTNQDFAYITDDNTATLSGDSGVCAWLRVGYGTGEEGTVWIKSGGTLTATSGTLGTEGTGFVDQDAGRLSVNSLALGLYEAVGRVCSRRLAAHTLAGMVCRRYSPPAHPTCFEYEEPPGGRADQLLRGTGRAPNAR